MTDLLEYTIYFENKATATAPSQKVFIDDHLDPHLDGTTFRFIEAGFGKTIAATDGTDQTYTRHMSIDNDEPERGRLLPEYRIGLCIRTGTNICVGSRTSHGSDGGVDVLDETGVVFHTMDLEWLECSRPLSYTMESMRYHA